MDVFIAIGGSFGGAIIALLIFIYLNKRPINIANKVQVKRYTASNDIFHKVILNFMILDLDQCQHQLYFLK